MAPLILFWGFIVIPEFMYRFKHSVPYYEILALDVSRVEYEHDKNNKKPDQRSIDLNEQAIKEARERREFKKMKLDDLK